MTENELARIVVDCALNVHKNLGPGLFESVYEAALVFELNKRGLQVGRQQPIEVSYENARLDIGFRADIIIDNKLIIEIKSTEAIASVHQKQVLTYLRLSTLKLGLLINFNVALLKDGIQRIVNNL